jgi:DNA (cytosine-5)-methyltransferase 1
MGRTSVRRVASGPVSLGLVAPSEEIRIVAEMSRPTLRQGALTAVDLFCGAGGLSEGLRQAGFTLVAAADHDPDACATYRGNFPTTRMFEGDLTRREVHGELVDYMQEHGELDLLAGGPPCQAFSQVRNHDRLLQDPRNRLYAEFVRLLNELRPRALLLENVPGLMQIQGGAVRWQIEENLSLGGEYRVSSAVLEAGDFGTPQSRTRLIFIGVRGDLQLPQHPTGSGVVAALRLMRAGAEYEVVGDRLQSPRLLSALADPADLTAVTAKQALSDLIEAGTTYSSAPQSAYQELMRRESAGPQDHVPSRIREDTVLRLSAIPPGGNVYDLPPDLARRYLTGTKWGPAGDGELLARKHYYAYRRLHPDWLAWTANTKADFAYHYELPRGLSVREAARLQGFPDAFQFITAPRGTPGQLAGGSRHSRYRQVGNAVPPPLASAVARTIRGEMERADQANAASYLVA